MWARSTKQRRSARRRREAYKQITAAPPPARTKDEAKKPKFVRFV